VAAFSPLLDVLADVPDPRRAQGQLYKLPHVLLFAILAIVTGCNSYRGIVTFIDVHRRKLNAAFGLNWRRAPAHTAVRYILQGLDPTGVETAFRRHAALLQAARATPGQGRAGQGSIALDGKTSIGPLIAGGCQPLSAVRSFQGDRLPQLRPYPRGGSMAANSSTSRSTMAWRASAVALSRSPSGNASAQSAYSAWSAINSAMASRHRCGRVRRSAGRL